MSETAWFCLKPYASSRHVSSMLPVQRHYRTGLNMSVISLLKLILMSKVPPVSASDQLET